MIFFCSLFVCINFFYILFVFSVFIIILFSFNFILLQRTTRTWTRLNYVSNWWTDNGKKIYSSLLYIQAGAYYYFISFFMYIFLFNDLFSSGLFVSCYKCVFVCVCVHSSLFLYEFVCVYVCTSVWLFRNNTVWILLSKVLFSNCYSKSFLFSLDL